MKVNATEQTSTFPVPLNKLKGRLMDSLGLTWETTHGTFEITTDTIEWIMKNATTSMFNKNRSYVYNKALYEAMKQTSIKKEMFSKDNLIDPAQALYNQLQKRSKYMKTDNRFQLIRDWAGERGLYSKGDKKTQYAKLMEESGELARAILKDDQEEFVDAIGDMVVVLTNLAHLGGTTIEDCIDSAYEVISKRKGKMVNGTFVKD